jgi:hypothetical protein
MNMPKPAPATQASLAGAMWLNSRLPPAVTCSRRSPSWKVHQGVLPPVKRTQRAPARSCGCAGVPWAARKSGLATTTRRTLPWV